MNEQKQLPPVDLGPVTPVGVDLAAVQTIPVEVVVAEPDHTARKHHRNSPSKLPYLKKCPGFKSDETGDKDAAEQGTRLHEYMDTILANYIADPTKRPLLAHLEEFSKSTPLDDNERSLLVFCIRELTLWISGGAIRDIKHEIKVSIHRGDGTILTQGHLDVLLIFKNGNALLLDYKFGWLPVDDASNNEQGFSYALGVLEEHPEMAQLGIEFIQPRLNRITQAIIKRENQVEFIDRIAQIIERAEFVQRLGFTPETITTLRTGSQCLYCAHSKEGTCPARLKLLGQTANAFKPVPLPTGLDIEKIDTPEKAALARYWVESIEDFLDPIKARAKEFALTSPDRAISITLADGTVIRYKIQDRAFDRSVGAALEVANALNNILTLEQCLACADLSLGKLEKAAADVIFEQTNGAEQKALQELDEKHRIMLAATPPQITKNAAANERKQLRASFANHRITKEAAKEQFSMLLTSQGLLTRPEGTTPTLARDKSAGRQLPASTQNTK